MGWLEVVWMGAEIGQWITGALIAVVIGLLIYMNTKEHKPRG